MAAQEKIRPSAKILIICLLAILPRLAFNQKILHPEPYSFQGRFINYRITNPAADDATTYIFFDSKGFMWSGTMNGLFRFDGIDYKSYLLNDSTGSGLEGFMVTGIIEDNKGKIWAGTYGALNCLDQRTGIIHHFSPDTLALLSKDNRIVYLYEDTKGFIWLITEGDLFAFNKGSESFKRYSIDSLGFRPTMYFVKRSGQIIEDQKGNIWIASPDGLYFYNRKDERIKVFRNVPGDKSSLSGNNITYISQDKTGLLWCSTLGGGLNKIVDPEKGLFEKIDLNINSEYSTRFDSIMTILHDKNDCIWTFGNGTLSCYDPEMKKALNYLLPDPKQLLPDRNLDFLSFEFAFNDNNGEIWFVNAGEGLVVRFNPETEKAIYYLVPNWAVFHCLFDKTGSFWFGCSNNNMQRLVLNSLPFQLLYINNMYSAYLPQVSRLLEDDEKKVWFITSSIIYRADSVGAKLPFSLKEFTFPNGEKSASCIFQDHKGDKWFGLNNGKITRSDKSGKKYTDFILPGNKSNLVTNIFEDRHRNIWFVSFNDLFVLPQGQNKIQILKFNNDRLNKSLAGGIWDVLIDSNDRIWFATFGDGIFVYDINTKNTTYYSSSSGLAIPYGDFCLRIEEDKKGRIWVLYLYNGLFLFEPASEQFTKPGYLNFASNGNGFIDIFIDKNNTIWASHKFGFTTINAEMRAVRQIPESQPGGSCLFYQLKSGEILNSRGPFLYLFPESIPSNSTVPDIYITSVLINNIPLNKVFPEEGDVTSVKRIYLNHKQNNLRIEFTALNYLESRNNKYRYFMNGIDDDTLNTSGINRYTEYKKIKPGKYRFWVTGSNNDGVWNNDGKTLEIRISQPWYKSVIALILYVFMTVALVMAILRIRLNQLRKEKMVLENEVHHRTLQLEEKNLHIEELDRLKTRFFTEISHEIRTPLSLIVGPVDNLIREFKGTEDERKIKWMEMIRRNGMKLLKLVDQLLDISRLDAGKMKVTLSESDILKFLRTLVYEYLSMAETRRITLSVKIRDGEYITYYDRDKVEKIVSNLLSNAFKFTPVSGTVTVSIDITNSGEITTLPLIIIKVSDTGVGISKEHIDRIFDRFYRVEGQWEKDGNGTGIGLSLVYDFINLMHGKIEVTSQQGSGSIFTVSIPLGKEHLRKDEFIIVNTDMDDELFQTHLLNSHADDYDKESEISEKNIQILLIEDNEDLRSFIHENLSPEYAIFEADNGKTGLEMAFAKVPDLILTDILMPDLDGIEVCSSLKNDERTNHIPVIILTAKTTLEDKIAGLKTGADDYLYKPFNINELRIRISNLLVQRERLRLKYGSLTGLEQYDPHFESLDDKFMKKIARIINENIGDFDFDVGILQEKVAMSRVHLYRKLKAITGLSPSTIIRNIRMKKAALLLNQKAGSILEIALSVGFSNPSYFAKCFRGYYGVSPREFTDPHIGQRGSEVISG